MTKEEYISRFWKAKFFIKKCGVYRILPTLEKENLIDADNRNSHYLQGRMRDDLFLFALEDLVEILKKIST